MVYQILIITKIEIILLLIKYIWQNSLIFLSEIVRKEIADIHDRSVVFTGEPSSALPHLVPADVFAVATWRFPSCSVVLPQTVLQEGLWQANLEETPVGSFTNWRWSNTLLRWPNYRSAKRETARHAGTYRNETRGKFMKTVPVIEFIITNTPYSPFCFQMFNL